MTQRIISFRPLGSSLGLMALFLLVACGAEGPMSEVMITDSAGVAVVSAPGEDVPLEWSAEEVLVIGAAETEEGGFFGITDLGVLAGDRIGVLDGDGKQVVLFDDQGVILSRHGREGSGPGEFQYPLNLIPRPDGGVSVYDMMNARFERFDAHLSPLASDPLQLAYSGGNVAYAGPFLVLPVRNLQNTEADVRTLLAINEADTVEIVEHSRPRGGSVQFESCGMALSGIAPLFSPRTLWAAGPDGVVAVVGTGRYEIDIHRGPGFSLERRIRREVAAIRATQAMAEAQVGDGMRVMTPAGERVCDAAEVVEEQGFASEVPPIARIAISPSGEIYLQRWAPEGEERATDVLSPRGEYLGTLAPGFPFPDAFLGTDRIVVQEEDEMELESVVVYRLVR